MTVCHIWGQVSVVLIKYSTAGMLAYNDTFQNPFNHFIQMNFVKLKGSKDNK